nr:reverse transcriptase domain-containing protein [Tanacetum cinerariifolium]
MRGILLSKGCCPSKRRNSLRTLNITSGTIPTFFGYVWIKSFDGVCMEKKLMISSKLVMKDPSGAPELAPTRMKLELVDRSITRPKGVAKDVFVKMGKFHFLTDFVVMDFEADLRVPLILGRSFLRTGHALIDVYGEEITVWVNDEYVTFNLNQTTRYSSTYDDLSVNRIDIIDFAREEYAQEILGFSNNSLGGNPTLTFGAYSF